MVGIFTFVDSFRKFGANVLFGKITLKTRKRLLSDDYTGEQGSSQGFYHIEVIKYAKNYLHLNFHAI